jgi:SAM-dependent methyltransferase
LYGTTDKTYEVIECDACRLIRLYPWPSPHELRHYYPPSYWFVPEQDTASRLEEAYRRFVLGDHVRFVAGALRHAGTHSRTPGSVLDVGCGGGLFLRMLAERGHKVMGLDFSLAAAAAAWRQNQVPVICGSLAAAPLPAGQFDVVTMFHVLEHLYDPVSYIEAARELLGPNGRLVVQVPNARSWQFLLLGEHWSGVDVPRHLFHFRSHDVEVLLDRCGFEVVRRKYFSLRDNPAGMATSLAPWLDPMARKIRHPGQSSRQRLWMDAAYLALAAACLPFTVLEAACHAGSTIMVEARKKG